MTREEALAVLENAAWLGKGEDIVLEALSVLKAIPDVVYCKDCIHRPVRNGEYIDAPKWENPPTEWDYYDYTCPYLDNDDYYNRRPLDNDFCSEGERG